jgi:tetratricopeptide (TPR) repeat protein
MKKYVFILLDILFFVSVSNSQTLQQKTTVFLKDSIATDASKTNEKAIQQYVEYLKEINQQSQNNLENTYSKHNNFLTWLSVLIGVLGLIIILIGFLGWTEYKKIKKMRKKMTKILSESENNKAALISMVSASNLRFTNMIREKASTKITHEKIDTFFRLKEYTIANELIDSFDISQEEEELQNRIKLFNGKIKYKVGNYIVSKECFTQLYNSNRFSNDNERFFILDMIGANCHGLFKETSETSHVNESIVKFREALEFTKDNYDRLRILSNIQASYSMLKQYEKVIKVYEEEVSKIEIGDNSKGCELDRKLMLDIKSTLIHSYWKLTNQKCFELFNDAINEFSIPSNEMKDYLVKVLNADEKQVITFIEDYEKWKSDQ